MIGLLATIIFVLASCDTMGAVPVPTGRPIACEELIDERALQLSLIPPTPNDAQAWVARVFDAEAEDNGREGNLRFLFWTSDGKSWSLHLVEGDPTLAVIWETNPPALREVIRCVGEPQYYNAFYDRGTLTSELGILYPSKGLSFGATQTGLVDSFTSTVAVTSISYYEPGTLEDTILNPVLVEPGSEQYARIRNAIKPWPGSLDKVVIGDPPY